MARGRQSWVEGGDGRGTPASLSAPADRHRRRFYAKQLPGTDHRRACSNGGRVDALADGIRLKRGPPTTAGFDAGRRSRVKLSGARDRWTWALASTPGIASSSYSVGGATTTKSQTTREPDDQHRHPAHVELRAPRPTATSAASPTARTVRTGTTSDASYLYSTVARRPLRDAVHPDVPPPQAALDLAVTYAAIPDSGTRRAAARRVPESCALPDPWGVTGLGAGGDARLRDRGLGVRPDRQPRLRRRQLHDRSATRDGSQEVAQPYLAAFDATTGEWISGFRLTLDNQVKALRGAAGRPPRGRRRVLDARRQGGDRARGRRARRRAHATRASRPRFGQTAKGAKRWVRALDVARVLPLRGRRLHDVHGRHARRRRYAFRNIVRVDLRTGTPSTSWRPNLGTGHASRPNGKRSVALQRAVARRLGRRQDGLRRRPVPAGLRRRRRQGASVSRPGAAAIPTDDPGHVPVVVACRYSTAKQARRSTSRPCKRVGSRVWLGGSQHSFFALRRSGSR